MCNQFSFFLLILWRKVKIHFMIIVIYIYLLKTNDNIMEIFYIGYFKKKLNYVRYISC